MCVCVCLGSYLFNKAELKNTDGCLQTASMDGTCYIKSTQGTLDIVGELATNVV